MCTPSILVSTFLFVVSICVVLFSVQILRAMSNGFSTLFHKGSLSDPQKNICFINSWIQYSHYSILTYIKSPETMGFFLGMSTCLGPWLQRWQHRNRWHLDSQRLQIVHALFGIETFQLGLTDKRSSMRPRSIIL
jgi:hypothetical protein